MDLAAGVRRHDSPETSVRSGHPLRKTDGEQRLQSPEQTHTHTMTRGMTTEHTRYLDHTTVHTHTHIYNNKHTVVNTNKQNNTHTHTQ